tara:strand:+ start:70 stop:387 length:318 start_codon:yes stop_codon:yes gene_type:complete
MSLSVLLADASVFLYRHADGSLFTDLSIHVHPEDAATLHAELQKFGLHAEEEVRLQRKQGHRTVYTKYTSNEPETPATDDKLEVTVFISDNAERSSTYHPDVVNA